MANQNVKQQNDLLQNFPNHKIAKSKNFQEQSDNFQGKINNPKIKAIQNQNNLINGEDIRNHFVNNFTNPNPNIMNLNQIQFQTQTINTSR